MHRRRRASRSLFPDGDLPGMISQDAVSPVDSRRRSGVIAQPRISKPAGCWPNFWGKASIIGGQAEWIEVNNNGK